MIIEKTNVWYYILQVFTVFFVYQQILCKTNVKQYEMNMI